MKLIDLNKIERQSKEEEEEDIDLDRLLGGKAYWYPGIPAFYGPETRSVLVAGEITETVANTVISQMQQLHFDDPDSPIRVYVNTLGGCANSAFALYDWMRCLTTPIIGITYGHCSSAGLPILMGADLRLATANTRFFYHEIGGVYGINSTAESLEAIANYAWYQETMHQILVSRAKISKTRWNKFFNNKTSFYFGVEFAKEMKIIHDVFDEVKKKVTLIKE